MTPLSDALTAATGATILGASGTISTYYADEWYDFRLVTDKGELFAYVTNGEGIALEWKPTP